MKKQKEDEILKNTVKTFVYKTGKAFGKALLAAGLAAALIFGFVACNNEVSQKGPDTEINQPGGDEGEEEKPNPDNPGGDIEQPEDPDQGDEEEGEEEKPVDPDQGDEEEGEDEKPSIIVPGQLRDPESIEDVFPSYEFSENLTSEEKQALYIANIYQTNVLDTIENLLEDRLVKAFVGEEFQPSQISDIQYNVSSEDNLNVSKITISFNYLRNDSLSRFIAGSITPKSGTTISITDFYNYGKDLQDGKIDDSELKEKFDTAFESGRTGAKYNNEFSFNYDPSIQEASKPLTEALKNVAIKDKDLEIEMDENTKCYIVDGGYQLDTTLGSTAREISLFIKNDNGYQKLIYRIAEPNFDIDALVQKIEAGNYRMAATEKGKLSGHQITVIEEEDEAASTASENIEVKYYKITTTDKTGAAKIKYGSTVKLFDSMGRVAHTQGFSAANKKQIKKIVEKYTDDFANKEVFGEIGGYVITLDKER